MTPVFKIEANNKDITAKIAQYLISLRLIDGKGYESDSFEMTLADPLAEISWPTTEVELKVWLGFKEKELFYKGLYLTDEVEFTGAPDAWTIHARAADLVSSGLKAQKTKSWHQTNIGDIVTQLARQNNLKPDVSKVFFSFEIDHLDQTNESDMHFLTRLAKFNDAVGKVRNGKLTFKEIGDPEVLAGMPEFQLALHECEPGYSIRYAGKSEYTGVVARWHSHKEAKQKEFVYKPRKKTRRRWKSEKEREAALKKDWNDRQIKRAKDKAERERLKELEKVSNNQLVGSTGNVKTLKRIFSTQAEAQYAAKAEFERLARGRDSADFSVSSGRPEFAAECKVVLVGFRADIDTVWISKEVTHEFNKQSGLSTHLSLEKLQEEQE